MNNLKEIRKSKGLTQSQVAEQAGMPFRTYQCYEYGEREPSLGNARKIARVLKTSVDKLFPVGT